VARRSRRLGKGNHDDINPWRSLTKKPDLEASFFSSVHVPHQCGCSSSNRCESARRRDKPLAVYWFAVWRMNPGSATCTPDRFHEEA